MSRKDYGVIAAAIKARRCEAGDPAQAHVNEHIDDLVEDLIRYFSQDNPRFDANRFRKATGMIVD